VSIQSSSSVRCRAITDADRDDVVALLTVGFKGRSPDYWRQGIVKLSKRTVPEGCPRYGYVLETGGRLVGIILLIGALREEDQAPIKTANVAGWFVMPEYRGYAQLLVSMALRRKDISYLNVTPAPHTWPIIEHQGYRRYCSGLFFAVAALKPPVPGVEIQTITAEKNPPHIQELQEFVMLRDHASFGCLVLAAREGSAIHPFVFRSFRIKSGRIWTPGAMTIYARDQALVVRLAGNIGKFLFRYAMPFIIMDANGPIDGLTGIYTERSGRKYVKGPYQPPLCDLSYTELAIFGL
jgi:hypothetical protein